jgi:hypothetical protein
VLADVTVTTPEDDARLMAKPVVGRLTTTLRDARVPLLAKQLLRLAGLKYTGTNRRYVYLLVSRGVFSRSRDGLLSYHNPPDG